MFKKVQRGFGDQNNKNVKLSLKKTQQRHNYSQDCLYRSLKLC